MKRLTRVCCVVAMLVMSLVAVTAASAALKAFSPNPARVNGVSVGGLPAWYQDQNGVSVQPCLDIANCGLAGAAEPGVFDPGLPLVFPTNFPSEAFFFDAVSSNFTVGGVDVFVINALEFTFVDPVTGALITPSPTALGVPFMRLRMVVRPPAGLAVAAGVWIIDHPWGTTTFDSNSACRNLAPGVTCRMTLDLPLPGAIPPNFAAALGVGVPGSMSTFLKSDVPPPPQGFLGNAAAATSVTGGAVRNSVTVRDPLGNSATTSAFQLLTGKTIGMDLQPGANLDLGGTNIVTPALVPRTVTVTNAMANSITFPALATAGVDLGDFIVAPPTQPAAPAPALADCSGATIPTLGTCGFDITFKPGAAAKAARVATLLLAPTTVQPAPVPVPPLDDPPPITMNLTGTALVDVVTTAAGHGTITPGTQAVGAGTAVTLTVAPSNKKFKVKDVVDGAAIVPASATDPTSFTITNVGAVNHAVTANFIPSGDLNQDGKLDIADAQKALVLAVGLLAADSDDPDNSAVDAAPLVGGVPAPDAKVGVGDVVVILRRVLNLDNW